MKTQISRKLRMPLSVIIALCLHTSVIFAISFSFTPTNPKLPPALDVIIVQSKQSDEKIKDADYLANTSHEGGGEFDTNKRKKSLFQSFEDTKMNGIAQIQSQQQIKQQQQKKTKLITAQQADKKIQSSDKPEQNKSLNNSQQITQPELTIARLTAEINKDIQDYSKRPRKQFVHARTKNTPAAAYMHNWIKRVEFMGNKHYPTEIRKKNLKGSLILVVAIKSDGKVLEVRIKKKSGINLLDQAARNIVYQSSPFAAFTGELKKNSDILYITRTWQFTSNTFR
ncbi:MAG: hypothetical protein DRQ51_07060 [Gammaproteobacteria bacterium]|nr:MAG: hypothetical protein DRQ51_07060 [Gammaproteobacteria bacterium]